METTVQDWALVQLWNQHCVDENGNINCLKVFVVVLQMAFVAEFLNSAITRKVDIG